MIDIKTNHFQLLLLAGNGYVSLSHQCLAKSQLQFCYCHKTNYEENLCFFLLSALEYQRLKPPKTSKQNMSDKVM